jgi:hypothetical protein
MRWSAVAAMRPALSPCGVAKEMQMDAGHTGCTYADLRLLPLLRYHGCFMDQEAFSPERYLAG